MSDGCAAQYILCCHLDDFGVRAEWHVFATSLGNLQEMVLWVPQSELPVEPAFSDHTKIKFSLHASYTSLPLVKSKGCTSPSFHRRSMTERPAY